MSYCSVCGGECRVFVQAGPNDMSDRDWNAAAHKSVAGIEMAETVLEEAQRIIYGDREQTYGHPAKNFDATAVLWNAWIKVKHGPGAPRLDRFDVAMMMVQLKMAREAHQHKRDNITDICGYAACIQKIVDFEA